MFYLRNAFVMEGNSYVLRCPDFGGWENECKESCKAEKFLKSTLNKARHVIDVFISHDDVLISWSCD